VSGYECRVLSDLVYQVGYEKERSKREPTPGEHVGLPHTFQSFFPLIPRSSSASVRKRRR
jgi:hypothetical protein